MNQIMGGYVDYLSLPNTNCVKGIFALFVLIHHLYQHSGLFHDTYIGVIFQGLGYLSVAVFFFLSGYGLRISHNTKGYQYVNSIPKKRMLPLYVQCIVLIALYVVLHIVIGKEIQIGTILQSFLWGNTIIVNGWYLQAILVLYGLYYLVYGIFDRQKHNKPGLHIIMFAVLVIYVLIYILLGKAITWYQSIFAFILGVIWCDYREWFDKGFNKHWIASGITAVIAFAVLFIIGLKIKYFTILAALAFAVLVVILLMKISVNCAVTRWLGKYYFEIYVMQGIPLLLFHSELVYIENKWLYVLVCTIATLLLVLVIHPIFQFISSMVKGQRSQKSY